jgi:hypothetical protein
MKTNSKYTKVQINQIIRKKIALAVSRASYEVTLSSADMSRAVKDVFERFYYSTEHLVWNNDTYRPYSKKDTEDQIAFLATEWVG